VQLSASNLFDSGALTNISSRSVHQVADPRGAACAHFQRRIQVLTADRRIQGGPPRSALPGAHGFDASRQRPSSDTRDSRRSGTTAQRNFAAVLEAAESLLARIPLQRDAMLFLAIAQRYLGRIPDALKTLADSSGIIPRFSRPPRGAGHCHVVLRQAPQAIESFFKASTINNALPASWSMLEGLYRMTGRAQDAQMAASQVAALRQYPPGDRDRDEPASGRRSGRCRANGSHLLAGRMAITWKPCDCWPGSAWLARCSTMPSCCLAAVLELAPDYRAGANRVRRVLIELHREADARQRARTADPGGSPESAYYQSSMPRLRRAPESMRGHRLYQELLNGTPADAECTCRSRTPEDTRAAR